MTTRELVLPFNKIRHKDTIVVGGKTSSLGEMIAKVKVPIPQGFAVTAESYKYYIRYNKLDARIRRIIRKTDIKNVNSLRKAGSEIRTLVRNGEIPAELEKHILGSFKKLGAKRVAVRSSATAEDLPRASFAGQQASFLNVDEKNLIRRVKDCMASLWTDRAISYREDHKFDHFKVWLSVAIQKMVNSKASGVMFTLDPDTGHRGFVFINGAWGLGDYIVQGNTDPDQFYIHKDTMSIISKKLGVKKRMEIRTLQGVKGKQTPNTMRKKLCLSDSDILRLAKWAKLIEKHYKTPMDIEWAKGEDGKLYILQARPETVHSQKTQKTILKDYKLIQKGKQILNGLSIGRSIVSGVVNVIPDIKRIQKFRKGQILVTRMTDPDWEPIMKIAGGIVTEVGGRTSHCAIVARELGVPAVVGADGATRKLRSGQKITIDCTEETGKIFSGFLKFKEFHHQLKKIPKTKTKLYINVGNPDIALDNSQLPVDGVGLARQEFIINSYISEHPLAMIKQKRGQIYIDRLAEGIAKIAAAFYPRPVVVRLSDFKSNEYRGLKGGKEFEPEEENPMIGWRGASRYTNPIFQPAFRLECKALKKVRDKMKLNNIIIMVPFCRTVEEGRAVLKIMASEGLKRRKNNLKVYVMAEIPSDVIVVDEFAKIFDGFSIGSNDLTQLTLGIDRDSKIIAKEFNERDIAVKREIVSLIKGAHKAKRTVGICGEAPSNYPEFARFLVKNKIDSISVEADVAIKTRFIVKRAEKR
ncbi:MAG: phosphoenolpyruvate synthase [Candidatus Aenigmatarchaeota archaeon]